MATKIKVKVTDNGPQVCPVMGKLHHALRDTTAGKVYDAVQYEAGEVDSYGDYCEQAGILLHDDVGDVVFIYDRDGWEVV